MTVAAQTPLEKRLLSDLEWLAVPRNSRLDQFSHMAIAHRIRERLASFVKPGGPELFEHEFGQRGTKGTNFILKIPGRDPSLDPILIGSHYDGPAGSPGADDNASAVAALLELAAHWSKDQPLREVWLVAFDQEELGMVGSSALAQDLMESGQSLKLMISLEMLAFTSEKQRYPIPGMEAIYGKRGDFIALVSNIGASPLLPSLLKGFRGLVPAKGLPVPANAPGLEEVRLSDHSPFWDRGYNAVMVTDTAFMRNINYHTKLDTVESLDIPFFASVVEGLKKSLHSF